MWTNLKTGKPEKGEEVEYQVRIFNDGSVNLKLEVMDPAITSETKDGIVVQKNHQALKLDTDYTVDPEKNTVVFTNETAPLDQLIISYKVKIPQDAVKKYSNKVTAAYEDTKGKQEQSAETTVPVADRNLVSTASMSPNPVKSGDVAEYSLTIENKGNVTEKNVTVGMNLAGMAYVSGKVTTGNPAATRDLTAADYTVLGNKMKLTAAAAPGDKYELKFSYTVKPADIGEVDTLRKPFKVNAADVTCEAETAGISVAVAFTDKSSGYVPGDVMTFTVSVTNTGSAELSSVNLSCLSTALKGAFAMAGDPVTTLKKGETVSRNFTYVVQENDWNSASKKVGVNINASGKAGAAEVTASTQTVATLAGKNVSYTTSLSVNKDALVVAGDTLTYTFELRNTGNTALKDVQIINSMNGERSPRRTGSETSLGSAASFTSLTDSKVEVATIPVGTTVRLQYSYTVTAADVISRLAISFSVNTTPSEGGVQEKS